MRLATGADPAEPHRGAYSSEDEALALIEAEGGLQAVVRAGMDRVGLIPTRQPIRGDVGLVMMETARGEPLVGAICTGPLWAAMSRDGPRFFRGRVRTAWSVPGG